MGLLDDAIREHLELRRLHGADSSEVSREELEALGLVRAPAARIERDLPIENRGRAERVVDEHAFAGRDTQDSPPDPDVNQETVELDMRALLEEDLPGETHDATCETPEHTIKVSRAGAATW